MNPVVRFFKNNGTLLAFLVLFAFASLRYDSFLTWRNISNVLRQSSIIGIIAIGMMFVVVSGAIDLSVGSTAAMSGVLAAMLCQTNVYLAIAASLLFGLAVGLINGFLVSGVRMEPFIASLATMMGVRGIAYIATDEMSIGFTSPPELFKYLGRGSFLGFMPFQILLFVALTLLAAYVFRAREFGRGVYAVGGNREAAVMMGVDARKICYRVYAISGALSALGGIILASRLNAGQPVAGDGYEMRAIASIVIGGVYLTGGVGKVSGMFLGVLLLNIINNIFNMQGNISSWWQNVILGLILMIVVIGQSLVSAGNRPRRAPAPGKPGRI